MKNHFLMRLVEKTTRHKRYMPKVKWDKRIWIANIFRLKEKIFGRRIEIRKETATYVHVEEGIPSVLHEVYTFEARLVFIETVIRYWLSLISFDFDFSTDFAKFDPKYMILGAIALDANTNGSTTSTSPLTFSHTSTGSNLILLVGVGNTATSPTISTPTYNSINMTLAGSKETNGNNMAAMYWQIAPSTGANTVSVGFGGTSPFCNAVAVTYSGASQTGQPDASGGNIGSSAPNPNWNTVANNCWAACVLCAVSVSGGNHTTRGGVLTLTGTTGMEFQDTNGPITPAGNITFAWSATTTTWAGAGMSFSPASGDSISLTESTAPSDTSLVETVDLISLVDSTVPSDVLSTEIVDLISISEFTAPNDVQTTEIVNLVSLIDLTAPIDISIVEIANLVFVTESTAPTDLPTIEMVDLISLTESTAPIDIIGIVTSYVVVVSDFTAPVDVLGYYPETVVPVDSMIMETIDLVSLTDSTAPNEVFSIEVIDTIVSIVDFTAPSDSFAIEVVDLISLIDSTAPSESFTVFSPYLTINPIETTAPVEVLALYVPVNIFSIVETAVPSDVVQFNYYKIVIYENLGSNQTDQSQTQTSGAYAVGTTGQPKAGQQFTVSLNPNQLQTALPRVTVGLAKVGSPTDSIRMEIWSLDASGLPSLLLQISDNVISNASMATYPTFNSFDFTFANPPILTRGTQYAFSVTRTSSLDDNNSYALITKAPKAYTGGNALFQSTKWNTDTTLSVYFTTYQSFSPDDYLATNVYLTLNESLLDTTAPSESFSVMIANLISLTDSTAPIDTFSILIPINYISVLDSTAPGDLITVEVLNYISVLDSTAPTEVLSFESLDLVLETTDSTAPTELLVAEIINLVSLNDSTAPSEVVSLDLVNFISLTDSTAPSDVVTQETIDLISVTDFTAPADQLVITVPSYINITDSTVPSEVLSGEVINFVSLFDNTSPTESLAINTLLLETISVTDSTAPNDLVILETIDEVSLIESTAPTEVFAITSQSYISILDSTAPSEAFSVETLDFIIEITDSSLPTDIASVEMIDDISLTETTAPTEVLILQVTNYISLTDFTAPIEVISFIEDYDINLTEFTAPLDLLSIETLDFVIEISDSTAPSEVLTIGIVNFVAITEFTAPNDISVTESVDLIIVSDTTQAGTLFSETFDNKLAASISEGTAPQDTPKVSIETYTVMHTPKLVGAFSSFSLVTGGKAIDSNR